MGKIRTSSSYDDKFLDQVSQSDFYKKWSENANNKKIALTNAFDSEKHQVDFDSSNQDYVDEGVNPFLNQFVDLQSKDPYNELRSVNQVGISEIASGLGRVGTKTLAEITKTVGATFGTIGAIGENIEDVISGKDEHSFLETAFNNRFIKTIDEIHKNANDSYLPLYVSESVENGDFFDKIKSPEFWATEGADGVGFMLSMLAPGAAFKALNLSEKTLATTAKLTNTLKLTKNLEKSIETVAKLGGKSNSAVDKLNNVAITGINTYFEAGVEAAGAMDNIEKNKDKINEQFINSLEFQNQVQQNNLQLSQLINSGQITSEQAQQQSLEFQDQLTEGNFKRVKGDVGANVFWNNAALLSLSNFRQTKMLFGNQTIKYSDKLLTPTLKERVKTGLLKTGESFLSEGGEELAQTSFEKRNVEKALEGKLGKGYFGNVAQDISESAEHIFKTLNTTEGQISAFLGGVLGRGTEQITNVIKGSETKERNENNRVYDLIQSTKNNINDLINTDLYENETSVDKSGQVTQSYKTDNEGKRIFKPESVDKMLKAVASVSKDSNEFDKAVTNHDYNKVEELQNKAESALIQGFITEQGVALDALEQHLNTLFNTEVKDASKEGAQERIKQTIDHAKHLQKAFNTFNDFHSHFVKIDNPNIENEDIVNYSNQLRNQHLSLKSLEYFQNKKINQLNDKIRNRQSDLYEERKNLGLDEKYIPKDETITPLEKGQEISLDDLRKDYLPKDDELITSFNNEKDKYVESLKDTQDALNYIWDTKNINNSIEKEVDNKNALKEDLATKSELHDEYISSLTNATSLEELETIGQEMTSKGVSSPLLLKTYTEKKTELELINKEQIDTETEENEIDSVNSEIDKEAEGIEDVKDNPEIDGFEEVDNVPSELQEEDELEQDETDDFVKEITTEEIIDSSLPGVALRFLDNVSDFFNDFISFARTPMEKKGIPVTFELNNRIEGRSNENVALDIFNQLKFNAVSYSNLSAEELSILENHLPIITNIKYGTKKAQTILETKLVKGENEGNIKMQNDIFDKESLPFRRSLIKEMINNNYSFKGISSEISKQLNDDLITVEEEGTILNLQSIKTIKTKKDKFNFIKDNLFYVSKKGNLVNVLNGEPNFSYKLTKGAGEIYLIIPNNNNTNFNLKLNTKRISEEKSLIIYDLLKILSLKTLSFKGKNIEKVPLKAIEGKPEFEKIINGLKTEVKLLKSEIKNPTIEDLLSLLMHTATKNGRTSVKRTDNNSGDWQFGSMFVNSKNPEDLTVVSVKEFETDDKKEEIIRFIQLKRHNVLLDHDVFNIENDNYLEYLVNNEILNTNVIPYESSNHNNTSSFQGRSKIYIDSSIKTTKTKKVTIKTQPSVKIEAPTLFTQSSIPISNVDIETDNDIEGLNSELIQVLEQQKQLPESLQHMFDAKIAELKVQIVKLKPVEKVIKNKETVSNVVDDQINAFNNADVKNRVALRKQYKDAMMKIDASSVEIIDKLFNIKDGITRISEVSKILNSLYNTTISEIKNNNNKKC